MLVNANILRFRGDEMNKTELYRESRFFNYTHTRSANMPALHYHDHYEVYYLISGCRRYLINDEMIDIYPGELVLIPPMTLHRTVNIPNALGSGYHARYLLSPHREMIPDVFLHLFDKHHYRFDNGTQTVIGDIFSEIAENADLSDQYSAHLNQASLIKLLCVIGRNSNHTNKHNEKDKYAALMEQVTDYIKLHCSEDITLYETAKFFGYSMEYFSQLFKTQIGICFNDYLNQMRISNASALLLSTSLSVSKICSQCGFQNCNYFSAVFKKKLGITPTAFRKQQSK